MTVEAFEYRFSMRVSRQYAELLEKVQACAPVSKDKPKQEQKDRT